MTDKRFTLALLGGIAVIVSTSSFASPTVALDSALYVERVQQQGGGQLRSLEPANRLAHGDRVVTVVTWYRMGGLGGFTVTNPLPHALAYQGSANSDEEVSVDGGKTWGRLGAMRIGGRVASTEDITHVRWRISQAQSLSGTGRIAYSSFVR